MNKILPNRGPLVSEATTLPTEPQRLPNTHFLCKEQYHLTFDLLDTGLNSVGLCELK